MYKKKEVILVLLYTAMQALIIMLAIILIHDKKYRNKQ